MKALKILAVILLATFAFSSANAQKPKMRFKARFRHHHVVRHPNGPIVHHRR